MKNAIFIPSSNRMAFALANVLMSIVDNSGNILVNTDVIVVTDDMCEKNRQVIRKIIPNVKFVPLFKDVPSEILQDKKLFNNHWGIYVLQSLYGFELVRHYEYVLGMETDMYVMSDISELFHLDCDIAWRNIRAFNPKNFLTGVLRNSNDNVFGPNAGLILFRNSLNNYNVDKKSFLEAYLYFKSVEGSVPISEGIFSYLCYVKNMKLRLLDWAYNNCDFDFSIADGKIAHFAGSIHKPWNNDFVGALMPEWFINHKKFLSYGGECEEVHIPTISRKKIYDSVEYGGRVINILPHLDIIKKENVQLHYVHGSRFLEFYISGWPTRIHYEVVFQIVNVTIALHVEGGFRASQAIMSTLQMLEPSLKNLLPDYNLVVQSNRISLEISWNEKDVPMINSLMNMLVEKTYSSMDAVLRGDGV